MRITNTGKDECNIDNNSIKMIIIATTMDTPNNETKNCIADNTRRNNDINNSNNSDDNTNKSEHNG